MKSNEESSYLAELEACPGICIGSPGLYCGLPEPVHGLHPSPVLREGPHERQRAEAAVGAVREREIDRALLGRGVCGGLDLWFGCLDERRGSFAGCVLRQACIIPSMGHFNHRHHCRCTRVQAFYA